MILTFKYKMPFTRYKPRYRVVQTEFDDYTQKYATWRSYTLQIRTEFYSPYIPNRVRRSWHAEYSAWLNSSDPRTSINMHYRSLSQAPWKICPNHWKPWEECSMAPNCSHYTGHYAVPTVEAWHANWKDCVAEQIIAAAWHPRRMVAWCLDISDQKLD